MHILGSSNECMSPEISREVKGNKHELSFSKYQLVVFCSNSLLMHEYVLSCHLLDGVFNNFIVGLFVMSCGDYGNMCSLGG